ncbi:MAG: GNAT family N-acetyltransferase [Oscillospiraceae bacterium]|jgi:phosphinothricin acetyltransferase|nr:GNAT family N-acetyltransferase [Oscillospiraceae bacterium]
MHIRAAKPEDIPAMLAIYAPFVKDSAYSFEYEVPSRSVFAARLKQYSAQFPWLVCEKDGAVLGYAYASGVFGGRAAYSWCAEISVYLDARIRGQGWGRTMYTCVEEILRKQGYRKVYGVIAAQNEGSMRFHEKMGYQKVAHFEKVGYKMGAWHDVVWYEKTLQAPGDPEEFPAPWDIYV